MPWADGTPCDGDSKWCQRGKCEPRGRGIPKPEDGGWGPWQKFVFYFCLSLNCFNCYCVKHFLKMPQIITIF